MTNLVLTTTDLGRQAILNAQANGLQLTITHVAVGDAHWTRPLSELAQEASLTSEQERVEIASSEVDAVNYQITINALFNSALEYEVNEVGFFGDDEHGTQRLIFVWSHATDTLAYKSAPLRLLLGMILTVLDAPLASITIQDNGMDLDLSLLPIEDDLSGTHTADGYHNFTGTDWRETAWMMASQQDEMLAEYIRASGQSGLIAVRQYDATGSLPFHTPKHIGFAPLNSHDHSNWEALPGIAEIAAVINGHYIRTRHLDYPLKHYDPGLSPSAVNAPIVPSEVSSKTTVAAQVEEMRQYLLAYQNNDPTHRAFGQHFHWTLSVLEIWPEILPASRIFTEPSASPRHVETDAELRQAISNQLKILSGGYKSRFENVSLLPSAIRQVDVNGEPGFVVWLWRVQARNVGVLLEYPRPSVVSVIDDLATRWRYGIDFKNWETDPRARFQVNRIKEALPDEGSYAGPDLLDELMGKIPGLDGTGHTPIEESYGGESTILTNKLTLYKYGEDPTTGQKLSAGYYNRLYTSLSGAAGRSGQRRGFHDPTLFVAATTQPNVFEHVYHTRDASGTIVDTTRNRFSYAIPLELILRTPLENFNPYGIDYQREESAGSAPTGTGAVGSPYSHAYDMGFKYFTPTELFSGAADTDPASTDPGAVYVNDSGGTARQVRASGIYRQLPTINGVPGRVRIRHPIVPIHQEGSLEYAQLSALAHEMGLVAIRQSEGLRDAQIGHEELKRRVARLEQLHDAYH